MVDGLSYPLINIQKAIDNCHSMPKCWEGHRLHREHCRRKTVDLTESKVLELKNHGDYPLVNCYIAIENCHL